MKTLVNKPVNKCGVLSDIIYSKTNIMVQVTESAGDSFNIMFFVNTKDGQIGSPTLRFENVDEMRGLADYIIGLAEELKKIR